MRRFAVPAVVATVAVVLLIVLAIGLAHQSPSTSIENAVAAGRTVAPPDAATALPALTGDPADAHMTATSLDDLRGRVVLVNFFASWCTTCQAEAPELDQAQKLLAAHGGEVLGVDDSDGPSQVLAYVHRYHLTYPVVRDVGENLYGAYSLDGYPDSFLVNRRGRIVAFDFTNITAQWIEQNIPKALAQPASGGSSAVAQ